MSANVESVGFQDKKAVVSGVNAERLSPGAVENASGIVSFIRDFEDAVKSGVAPSEFGPAFRKRAEEMQFKISEDDERYRKQTNFVVSIPNGGVTKEQLASMPAMIEVMYQMHDAVSSKHVSDAVQKLQDLNAAPVAAAVTAAAATPNPAAVQPEPQSTSSTPSAAAPAAASSSTLSRDKATAETFMMNLPPEMRAQQQVYKDVTERIIQSDAPRELDGKGLAAKAAWWGKNAGTPDEAKVAMELAFFAKEGRFPPSQTRDPNDQLTAGSQSAAHNAAQKTADMFGGTANSLTSLVSSMASGVKNIGVSGRIERATEAAYQETIGGKQDLNEGFKKLSDQVAALGKTAPGEGRDTLVKEITDGARSHMELADAISKKEARISADPNSKSEFKRDKSDIDADLEDRGSKLTDLLGKAQAAVPGDEKNTKALAEEQSKIKEMLERIKAMVKSIFSGFGKEESKAPAPGM